MPTTKSSAGKIAARKGRLATLHEAASALGIKTGERLQAKLNWQKLPLPWR